MIKVDCNYRIKDDIGFLMESEKINMLELSEKTKVSRTTINEILKTGTAHQDVCEKFYSYAYNRNYRINSVKEEFIKEKYGCVLFHGSKEGLSEISIAGSRDNCDFGKGFHLGETYNQALSFVCEKVSSSVYSFSYSLNDLKIKKYDCDLSWMIAICYYRGRLVDYSSNKMVQNIVKETNNADVIIAPIADNKMFYIMTQFVEGEINADVALHSLSASKLGLQYVIKTERALKNLKPIEKYFIPNPERDDCIRQLNQRGYEVDTKLKLAKREFKNGQYIEELLS